MATNKEILNQQRTALAEALTTLIESNQDLAWKPGWFSNGFNGGDRNAFTGQTYRGENLIATYFTRAIYGYQDNRWLTMKQANELGGKVKKGEKGLRLVRFIEYDILTKKAPNWTEIRALPLEESRQYIKDNVRVCAKTFTVFNVEQCEGLTKLKPIEVKTMSEAELAKQNAQIETIIKNSSAPVLYDGGDSAFYRPSTDDIHLPKVEYFKTKQDYYATALHEISHSTGHPSRLDRDLSGRFGTESYAIEELRAEISSMFLQSDLGLEVKGEVLESHAAYVKNWKEEITKPEVLGKVIEEAKSITEYIIQNYSARAKVKDAQSLFAADFPKDFETPFTEALLDHDEGKVK